MKENSHLMEACESKSHGYLALNIDEKAVLKFIEEVEKSHKELAGVSFDLENHMRSILVNKIIKNTSIDEIVELGERSPIFKLIHFAAAIGINGKGSKLLEQDSDDARAKKIPFIILEDFLEGQTVDAIERLWETFVP